MPVQLYCPKCKTTSSSVLPAWHPHFCASCSKRLFPTAAKPTEIHIEAKDVKINRPKVDRQLKSVGIRPSRPRPTISIGVTDTIPGELACPDYWREQL